MGRTQPHTARLSQRESVFCGSLFGTFKRYRTRLSTAVMQDTLPTGGSVAQATGEGRSAPQAKPESHVTSPSPSLRLDSPRGRVSFVGHFLETINATAHGSQWPLCKTPSRREGRSRKRPGRGVPRRRRSPSPTSLLPLRAYGSTLPEGECLLWVTFWKRSNVFGTFKRYRTWLSMAVMQDTLPSGGSVAQATGEGRSAPKAKPESHVTSPSPSLRLDSPRGRVSFVGHFLETFKRFWNVQTLPHTALNGRYARHPSRRDRAIARYRPLFCVNICSSAFVFHPAMSRFPRMLSFWVVSF